MADVENGITLFYLHRCCFQILFMQLVETDCSPRLSMQFPPIWELIAGSWGISTGSLENLSFQGCDRIEKKNKKTKHSLVILWWIKVHISRGEKIWFCVTAFGDLVSLLRALSVSCSVVPGSLRPHGLQSTRLFSPWDFPGKDNGVGCHFLLQGIFPAQGLNLGLLHCRQILYALTYEGSPTVDKLSYLPSFFPHWFSLPPCLPSPPSLVSFPFSRLSPCLPFFGVVVVVVRCIISHPHG